MADNSLLASGDTPEAVAYALLCGIAATEGHVIFGNAAIKGADKKWLLDTYAECLSTVRNPDGRLNPPKGF